MKRKTLLISFSFLALLGVALYINPDQFFTKLVLRLMGNYTPPEYETDANILGTLNKYGVTYDRAYKLKSYSDMTDMQKRKLYGLPFIQIYNAEKHLLKAASGNECKWALVSYFNSRDSIQLLAEDSTMYDIIMQKVIPIESSNARDSAEYYVLAGWANYAPKFAQELFKSTNGIKQTYGDNVHISYINLDYQEAWESEVEAIQK